MAFLKASGNPNPLSSFSVSLQTEAPTGRNGTVNSELTKDLLISNSSSGYVSLSRTEIPEILDIPSPLLRPPARDALAASFACEAQVHASTSSAFDARSETGKRCTVSHLLSAFTEQAPVFQRLESAIRQINHYPADNKWLLK